MAHITFSVVITVYNEEKSIEALLRSLQIQSLTPGEIIIVDAGSTDDTGALIKSAEKNSFIPIHLLVKPGVNRSVGRNIGIAAAVNTHIAVIDAGCEADARWLEALSLGFVDGMQAVAGFYIPVINKPIQRLFSLYVSTLPRDLDEAHYLPSSRSLAFTKKVWEDVGKYPEHVSTCEDLVFAVKLKQKGKMSVQRQALVSWRQAESFHDFFSQIKGYARGDIEAGYVPHVIKILSVWLRYVLMIIFWPLFFLYVLFPIVKHVREIGDIKDVFWLPMIQFTADAAVMLGSLLGMKSRLGFNGR